LQRDGHLAGKNIRISRGLFWTGMLLTEIREICSTDQKH